MCTVSLAYYSKRQTHTPNYVVAWNYTRYVDTRNTLTHKCWYSLLCNIVVMPTDTPLVQKKCAYVQDSCCLNIYTFPSYLFLFSKGDIFRYISHEMVLCRMKNPFGFLDRQHLPTVRIWAKTVGFIRWPDSFGDVWNTKVLLVFWAENQFRSKLPALRCGYVPSVLRKKCRATCAWFCQRTSHICFKI